MKTITIINIEKEELDGYNRLIELNPFQKFVYSVCNIEPSKQNFGCILHIKVSEQDFHKVHLGCLLDGNKQWRVIGRSDSNNILVIQSVGKISKIEEKELIYDYESKKLFIPGKIQINKR